MGCVLVGDLQLHTAVNHIGFQTVQFHDLGVAIALTEILLRNRPQGISVNNGS